MALEDDGALAIPATDVFLQAKCEVYLFPGEESEVEATDLAKGRGADEDE